MLIRIDVIGHINMKPLILISLVMLFLSSCTTIEKDKSSTTQTVESPDGTVTTTVQKNDTKKTEANVLYDRMAQENESCWRGAVEEAEALATRHSNVAEKLTDSNAQLALAVGYVIFINVDNVKTQEKVHACNQQMMYMAGYLTEKERGKWLSVQTGVRSLAMTAIAVAGFGALEGLIAGAGSQVIVNGARTAKDGGGDGSGSTSASGTNEASDINIILGNSNQQAGSDQTDLLTGGSQALEIGDSSVGVQGKNIDKPITAEDLNGTVNIDDADGNGNGLF